MVEQKRLCACKENSATLRIVSAGRGAKGALHAVETLKLVKNFMRNQNKLHNCIIIASICLSTKISRLF